jgi:hypothetical protein
VLDHIVLRELGVLAHDEQRDDLAGFLVGLSDCGGLEHAGVRHGDGLRLRSGTR